jgi:hypothetical protein
LLPLFLSTNANFGHTMQKQTTAEGVCSHEPASLRASPIGALKHGALNLRLGALQTAGARDTDFSPAGGCILQRALVREKSTSAGGCILQRVSTVFSKLIKRTMKI